MVSRLAAAGGVIAAIAALLILAPRYIASTKVETPTTKAELSAALLTQSQLYAALADNFPEEFNELVGELYAIGPQGEAAAEQLSSDYMIRFRMEYAEALLAATDQALTSYLASVAETYDAAALALSNAECGLFAAGHPDVLAAAIDDPRVFRAIDAQSAAMIRAMASATGQEPRALANQTDWNTFKRELAADPLSETYSPLVAEEVIVDPAYCAALVWYITAISTAEGDAGERVKASFAQRVATP
ncbi:MAG: hypothetical protein AAFR65_14920 [Pseudomonadota bacterium]